MAVSPDAIRVYQYLVARGLNPYAAAGLTGNLISESRLNTGASNPRDPGGSYGIGQWNRERRAALNAWRDPNAKDELERQLSFLMHELQTTEKAAYQRLLKAADITGGTAGGIAFERPAGYTGANPAGGSNWSGRLTNAQQVLAAAGGPPASGTGTATAVAPGPTRYTNIGDLSKQLIAEFPQLRQTSGYRSPEYNKQVGGAKDSQHTHGAAADFSLRGLDEATQERVIRRAIELGGRGIGYYPGSQSFHVDVRQGGSGNFWGPNYSRTSLGQTPKFFQNIAQGGIPGAVPPGGGTAVAGTPAVPTPVTASPTTVAQGPAPPSPERNLAEGIAGLLGGTVEDPSTPPPQEAPAAAPTPQPAVPTGPEQGSAASLMTSLIDRKRMDRGAMPLGLLDSIGVA
jgi:Phage tail lysozyme/Peptidase M15